MIKTALTEMFGLRYPIVQAPMGPFYTTLLATAVSEKGGLGVISHSNVIGTDPVKEMEKSINYLIEHTDKLFGINIRAARIQTDAPILIRRVTQLVNQNTRVRDQLVYGLTSAGGPKLAAKIWKEKAPSIKHFHVAPSFNFAQKIIAAGCDGIVATGYEGGGHQSYEAINSTVLLAEICQEWPDKPVIACGGFATGRGLAAALTYGACGIAMGTRFIATKECEFVQQYKDLILRSLDEATIISKGMFAPIRLIKNNFTESHGQALSRDEKIHHEQEMDLQALMEEAKAYESVYRGDVENGAVPAGQSVGMIEEVMGVDDLLQTIEREAEQALQRAAASIQ